MEEIQSIVKKVRLDLEQEIPEEEIIAALKPVLENEPEAAIQIINQLIDNPSPPVIRLLQYLLEIPCDKRIRKTIKRSFYRLKNQGIAVEQVTLREVAPVFKPLQTDPPRGFGGPFDTLGQRFLLLVIPIRGHGLTVMQGILSETEGLADFSGGEMPRKRFKLFFDEIQKGNPFPLIEIPPSYVGFLFTQAYHLTLERRKQPPQDYLRFRGEVDRIKKEYERPLIYSHIREADIEGDDQVLRRGGDLFMTDLFNTWRVGKEELRPYADAVWEAKESKLILNQAQKEARFQEIYRKALSDIFSEERRSLYQRRMEEMAYYLFKSKQEDEAKVSFAIALDLKKAPNLIQPSPFLFQMIVRSIFDLLAETDEKKKREFSLIARP